MDAEHRSPENDTGFSQQNATRRALLPAPGPHRWGSFLVVLLLLYFAQRGWMRSMRPAGSDFTIYYRAAQHALRGLDPMQVDRFLYLPSFAVLITPLALLPLPLASGLWHAASLVVILWAARRLASMAEEDCAGPMPWLAWLPLLGLLRLFDSNLSNGQVNAFTLAMLVASFSSLRRGRETSAGLWVGLATATKVLPAFALLYFLLRGRWRALLSGGLASLLLILILPVAALGWSGARRSLGAWGDAIASPALEDPRGLLSEDTYLPGQSPTATLFRLLTPMPATNRGEAGPKANLLDLDPHLVGRIALALGLLHLALFLLLLLRRRHALPPADRLLEMGLVLAMPLLLAPLVHKAHMIWLLPATTALLAGARRRGVPFFLTLFALAIIGLTTPSLLGREIATRLLSFNTVFVGLEAIFLALVWELFRRSRAGTRSGAA